MTVIAFIGSVFSPYYAAARRRGLADPENHASINAILYRPEGKRWAMTERGRGSVSRSPTRLAIGPSAVSASDGRIIIDIDEWSVPFPRKLSGRITVDPGPVFHDQHRLDAEGRHTWRPVAPCARVEVAFDRPALSWKGSAYVDMNYGSEPLEEGFRRWTWSRSDQGEATRILYDVEQRDGIRRNLALDYGRDGVIRPFDPPPIQPLPSTGWRVWRETRAAPEAPSHVLKGFEDTPFYSRSLLGGANMPSAIHESVDLDRFASRWVQTLLPFKMPRRR